MLIQQIIHELLGVEDYILIVVYLDHHFMIIHKLLGVKDFIVSVVSFDQHSFDFILLPKVCFIKYSTWLEHHLFWDTLIPFWYNSIYETMNSLRVEKIINKTSEQSLS